MVLALALPLLAAVADWMQVVGALVVLVFAVMKQLLDASKKANAKKRPEAPATRIEPKQKSDSTMQKPQTGGQQADQLRSQVEEFLRRAGRPPQAGKPPAPPDMPQQRPASEIEVLVSQPPRLQERRPLAASLRPAESPPMPTLPTPPSANRQRSPRRAKEHHQSVAEHMAEQSAARERAKTAKASHLGQRIVNEDLQFDTQLKAKFDHVLGSLAESGSTTQSPPTPPPDTPASQIAALLANPEGVRQAVLVNEILRRPSDRW